MVERLTNAFESSLGLLLAVTFPLSIVLSALAGSIALPRSMGKRAFYGWVFLGTAVSLLPAVQIDSSFGGTLLVVVALGGSLGLGMPLLLRCFAESLPIENRGTFGGITFFLVTASAPLIILTVSQLDLLPGALFLALWRGWSILTLGALPANAESQVQHERRTAFRDLFSNRAFVLYIIAWLLFSMVDGFEALATSQYKEELGSAMNVIEPIIAGVSALGGGVLADRAGRRRVIISGFVSLGVAYAILGIASQYQVSWLFYFVADGFAIGLLWAMFTIVIWGELATSGIEKYYALGETPFFLTQILYLLSRPYFASVLQSNTFSLAAFFLFIAVVPLFYAPETLPEKKIQDRQLRVYTEEAIKLKQKKQLS